MVCLAHLWQLLIIIIKGYEQLNIDITVVQTITYHMTWCCIDEWPEESQNSYIVFVDN